MKHEVIPQGGVDKILRELAALRREVRELRASIVKPAVDKASNGDFLYGAETIADFLGITTRQLYHLHETKNLPTFKMGRRVCARRADLDAWLAAQSEGRA